MITPRITADRYHDISCGHRVVDHEGKCQFLHGHNYRVHFTCEAANPEWGRVDTVGRVVDFSVIKSKLCMWLEDNWDHKFLAYTQDPLMVDLLNSIQRTTGDSPSTRRFEDSIVWVPFNPTAENIASHLLEVVGPDLFKGMGVRLVAVRVDETRKCSAAVNYPQGD